MNLFGVYTICGLQTCILADYVGLSKEQLLLLPTSTTFRKRKKIGNLSGRYFHILFCVQHIIHLDRCENKPSTQQCSPLPLYIPGLFFFFLLSLFFVYPYIHCYRPTTVCCSTLYIHVQDEKSKCFSSLSIYSERQRGSLTHINVHRWIWAPGVCNINLNRVFRHIV